MTIHDNWLGPDGLQQAENLGSKLPTLLADYATVNLIVTEGPGDGNKGTPNPLNTVTTFLVNLAKEFTEQHLNWKCALIMLMPKIHPCPLFLI